MPKNGRTALISATDAVANTTLTLDELKEGEENGDLKAFVNKNGERYYKASSLRRLLDELEGEEDAESNDVDSDDIEIDEFDL